jgi:hypothetical protein
MAQPLKKLSEQHIAFIEYLLQTNCNRTESAERAGYAKSTARIRGSELYNDPLIQAEYQARLAERVKAAGVTTEAVIAELAGIAFANIDDVVEWHGRRQIPNPHYLTPDQHNERDAMRQTQEALGHTLEPIDPFINTRDKFIWQGENVNLRDSKSLTRQLKAAVGEVSLTPGKFGDKLSIKMHSKLDALGKLINVLGINAPKKIDLNTTVDNISFAIKRRAPAEVPPDAPVSAPDTSTP